MSALDFDSVAVQSVKNIEEQIENHSEIRL